MLSTAFFSSHHGRFQPGKSPGKSSKSKSVNSKSVGHLAMDNDAPHVPTLRRYSKFNTSMNGYGQKPNSSSPPTPQRPPSVLNEIRQFVTIPEKLSVAAQVPQIDLKEDDDDEGIVIKTHEHSEIIVNDDDDDQRLPTPEPNEPTIQNIQNDDSFTDQDKLSDQPTVTAVYQNVASGLSKSETIQRRSNSSNYYVKENRRRSSVHRSSTSSSSSGKSTVSKLSEKVKLTVGNSSSSSHYQSCPDLLKPCLNRHASDDSGFSSTLSRHKFSKSEKNLYKQKPLGQWTLDDALLWLQSVGLEDVTTVLIGYEINGSDILQWNDQTLESLGISDEMKRTKVLAELHKLKTSQTNSNRNSPKKQSSQRYCSLFSMVRRSQYDRITVIELPPTTSVRDFTVATDPMETALVVTSCKAVAELKKGDLIIELNGVSCFKLPPVDFNKLLHELNGHKYQMVVLRKSDNVSTATENDSNDEQTSLQEEQNSDVLRL